MNPDPYVAIYCLYQLPVNPDNLLAAYGRSALFFQKILPGIEIAVNPYLLLISETALLTAVRTSPGNGVARHAPQIICHALLAYLKTTATDPAEGKFLSAEVAVITFLLSPFKSRLALYDLRFHGR